MAKRRIKLMLIILGCILCLPIIGIILLMIIMTFSKAVPNGYTGKVETGGQIEARYLANGPFDIETMECPIDSPMVKLTIFYPKELELKSSKWPLVLFVNGTGILPEKYDALFRHLASWGFIVAGNDDPSTGNGKSTNLTLDYLIRENKNKDSRLYAKVDTDNIGISGHSHGGAGVFNAITDSLHSFSYKTAVSLSPTQPAGAALLKFPYDLQKVNIPILILAGTEGDFETKMVIPIEAMDSMYSVITAPKIMARRIEADHGQMLYSCDGYVTAWFMWQLKGDRIASNAFANDQPEILSNPHYQNQQRCLVKQ